jgi:hypothetical protein
MIPLTKNKAKRSGQGVVKVAEIDLGLLLDGH